MFSQRRGRLVELSASVLYESIKGTAVCLCEAVWEMGNLCVASRRMHGYLHLPRRSGFFQNGVQLSPSQATLPVFCIIYTSTNPYGVHCETMTRQRPSSRTHAYCRRITYNNGTELHLFAHHAARPDGSLTVYYFIAPWISSSDTYSRAPPVRHAMNR